MSEERTDSKNDGQDNSPEEVESQDVQAVEDTTEAAAADVPGEPQVSGIPAIKAYLALHGVPWDFALHIAYAAAGLIAAGLLVIAFALYRAQAAGKVEDAARRFAQANSASALNEVLDRYSSAELKPAVLLRLGQAQFAEGNYALAYSTYEQFMKLYFEHALAPVAELGLVVCRESQGMTMDAIKGYEEYIAKHPAMFLTPDAELGKARCYETMGRFEEAKQAYDEFLVKHPDSSWTAKAEQAREIVKLRIERAKRMPAPTVNSMNTPVSVRLPAGPYATPTANQAP